MEGIRVRKQEGERKWL